MKVAIYCGSNMGNKNIYKEKAIELAEKLALNNISIVYGGSKQGLMGVISNHSLDLNNEVIGVITYDLASKELENERLKNIIKVDTLNQRKEKMEELSDAFIALPGGYGTFDEIFEVITKAHIGYHQKPCVFFNIDGYYDKLIEFLYSCSKNGFIGKDYVDMLIVSSDIDEIILKLKNYKAPKAKWDK